MSPPCEPIILKLNIILRAQNHRRPRLFHVSATAPLHFPPSFLEFPSRKFFHFSSPSLPPLSRPTTVQISKLESSFPDNGEEYEEGRENDLAPDGIVYRNTLRLVECAMFAAVTGLVYFLSNSLSIENYFGCFFSLPIVISSLRWGVAAGRKTVVATAMLLFVLSGPVKALTYLVSNILTTFATPLLVYSMSLVSLTHGLVGFTMGSLWRMRANWSLSVFLCTIARATGAVGYVLTSSFLIRENILALITVNIHASLTYIFTAAGINIVPSMNAIYILFSILVSVVFPCPSC
ncbi:hypothetical protein Tsubulata_033474 [Turnera subulata]|uniref:Uncharacterized protein n=1 Tax=Turnera subulata TaxID=218843 RepID=A0A9Q0G7U5_9ROSI|nr:hypothetical protein Tsubulata_033474 [Turnera subulata]